MKSRCEKCGRYIDRRTGSTNRLCVVCRPALLDVKHRRSLLGQRPLFAPPVIAKPPKPKED